MALAYHQCRRCNWSTYVLYSIYCITVYSTSQICAVGSTIKLAVSKYQLCLILQFLSLSPSPVVWPPVQVRLAPSSWLPLPARPEGRRDTPSPQQVPLPLTVVCVSSPDVAVSAVRSRMNSILILHSTEYSLHLNTYNPFSTFLMRSVCVCQRSLIGCLRIYSTHVLVLYVIVACNTVNRLESVTVWLTLLCYATPVPPLVCCGCSVVHYLLPIRLLCLLISNSMPLHP